MNDQEIGPTISQYFYITDRDEFTRSEDQYPHWMALIPEEGNFHYDLLGSTGTAQFGEAIFCPPHTLFKRKIVSKLTFHVIEFLWVAPTEETPLSLRLPQGKITFHDKNRLYSTLNYLEGANRLEDQSFHELWRNTLLYELILLYQYEQAERSKQLRHKRDPLMGEAADRFVKQMDQNILIKDIAPELGLSPIQFNRRFKQAYDMTPLEYLTQKRLEKAQALLLTTDMTIDTIAAACGYQSGFYLSKLFAAHLKVSPSQFRRSHSV